MTTQNRQNPEATFNRKRTVIINDNATAMVLQAAVTTDGLCRNALSELAQKDPAAFTALYGELIQHIGEFNRLLNNCNNRVTKAIRAANNNGRKRGGGNQNRRPAGNTKPQNNATPQKQPETKTATSPATKAAAPKDAAKAETSSTSKVAPVKDAAKEKAPAKSTAKATPKTEATKKPASAAAASEPASADPTK